MSYETAQLSEGCCLLISYMYSEIYGLGGISMIYMLAPNYDEKHSNKRKKMNKPKKVKQTRQKSSFKPMLCIMLVMILMLTAWIQEKTNASDPTEDVAIQDFLLLSEWGEKLLQGGALAEEWSFRWELTLLQGTMEQLADQLFISEKGVRLAKEVRENGNVIEGDVHLPPAHLKLVRTDQDHIAEKITVMLQVKGSEIKQLSDFKDGIAKLHQLFRKQDQHVQMSMKIFGKPKDAYAIESLKQLAIAQQVEEYVDRGTTSTTLFSSRIKQYLWLNNEKMANLQASLHESTADGEFTLTIGIPLISGEFGSVMDQQPIEHN